MISVVFFLPGLRDLALPAALALLAGLRGFLLSRGISASAVASAVSASAASASAVAASEVSASAFDFLLALFLGRTFGTAMTGDEGTASSATAAMTGDEGTASSATGVPEGTVSFKGSH